MNRLKNSPALVTGILVAIMTAVGFCLRVCLSYGEIFKGDWIKYASADAYFHMRLVDTLAANFPNMTSFDVYNTFPGGNPVAGPHMFVRMMAGVASFFGLVEPSQHAIDVVGVFTPPLLAALTIILIFFIGRELFGRWGGILSALLAAIIPGEFLSRTKLGFTDYHCFEIFLTTLFILFIILALKAAKNNELKFGDFLSRNWQALRKPLIFGLLAGIVYAIYAATWTGSPMFVFIVFIFFMIQFVIDHLRKRSTDYLTITGSVIFAAALLALVFSSLGTIVFGSLAIALVGCIALGSLSRFMSAKNMKGMLYPAAILVLAGAGFGIFYAIFPSVASSMLKTFAIFNPQGVELTTIEMQPLISDTYGNPLTIVWGNYNTTFFLAFVSLALLIYEAFKKGNSEKTLLLVWSIVILISNLAQRRFGYYYGVNVALLVGYLAWTVIDLARSRIFNETVKQAMAKAKQIKTKALKNKSSQSFIPQYVTMSLVVILVFFTGYFWSIETTVEAASAVTYAPSDAWCNALDWVRENTPEPLGDDEAYYELIESGEYQPYTSLLALYADTDDMTDPDVYTSLDEYYPYPDTAYGVLSWWDYGYWISRIAHRIPVANPSQDSRAIRDVANFMIAQDEETATAIVEKLGVEYFMVDLETAYVQSYTGGGKLWAVITWADQPVSDYYDVYLVADGDTGTQYRQQVLYNEAYYRSMVVRMYNFNCEAYTPTMVWAIGYAEQADVDGNLYKVVTAAESFGSYEEAQAYIDEQEEGNYRIVGVDPMQSCVPLEALENYETVYESPQGYVLTSDNVTTGAVRVFQYTD